MADLALTQPPPLSACLSLEQHLNISGIRPVKLGSCQNKYLEIFIIMLLFLSPKCPLFKMKFFCINLLSYASFHQTAELPDLTF